MHPAVGKLVSGRLYLHTSTSLPPTAGGTAASIARAEELAGVSKGDGYQVVGIADDGSTVALLAYPAFFDDPFPSLAASWLVDLQSGTVSFRTYADSLNPPILHRKELLLPADHPRRAEFVALTEACEAIGLFDEPTRIG